MPDLQQLLKLHQAEPEDTFCTYAIAMEYSKQREHAEAVAWFDRTLTLDPQYCYAYYQKARSLSMLGQHDDAKQVLKAGLDAATRTGDQKAHSELAELLASYDIG